MTCFRHTAVVYLREKKKSLVHQACFLNFTEEELLQDAGALVVLALGGVVLLAVGEHSL